MRVALMGIVHESNSFVKELTTLDHFRKGHWLFGEDIVKEYKDAFHEIGGLLEAMEEAGIEVVPIMYAEATPGGIVSKQAIDHLMSEMFSMLKAKLPVDGCLVVPHGAGVSEAYDDMDGHWLSALRSLVGPAIPIIGTIDPHANVSEAMTASTTALVAYKTNPHIDQRRTGKEAGNLMAGTLKGKIKPIQFFKAVPIAISIEQQLTSSEPCKELLSVASKIGAQKNILSTSVVLGFPYADVAEMGSSVIVIADGDQQAGEAGLSELVNYITEKKERFNGVKQDIDEIISSIDSMPKPILLLDMGDNVGGGAPGNSIYLLDHLEISGKKKSFICIYDPAAVKEASQFEPGMSFNIRFGGRPDHEKSTSRNAVLIRKGSGKFSETAPRHGGQVHFDMGDIAILETGPSHIVMLTSRRVPPFSLKQLTSFGIDPHQFETIVAKGVNAPVAAYKEVCPTIIQVNTPGVTQADMTRFIYKNRRKPLFPFEDLIEFHD